MINKLVVIINSLKVPKIKKILLYEMKFLVTNYSCLQNPWLGGYRPQIPVVSVLNWICWTPHPEQNSWIRQWHTRRNQISSFGETDESIGASVQSTAGSRVVRISGSNAGNTMFRGSVKSTGYPLHSLVSTSLPLPCVTVYISTGVYYVMLNRYSTRNRKKTRCFRLFISVSAKTSDIGAFGYIFVD